MLRAAVTGSLKLKRLSLRFIGIVRTREPMGKVAAVLLWFWSTYLGRRKSLRHLAPYETSQRTGRVCVGHETAIERFAQLVELFLPLRFLLLRLLLVVVRRNFKKLSKSGYVIAAAQNSTGFRNVIITYLELHLRMQQRRRFHLALSLSVCLSVGRSVGRILQTAL